MTSVSDSKTKVNLSLDYRLIVVALVVVIIGMLLLWRPWTAKSSDDRTVSVNGETTLRAEPDEYVFYPMFEVEMADKQAALNELTKKSEAVIAELKKLGVADKAIKSNTSGYDYPVYKDDQSTYSLQLTITLDDKDLAQKVQDYLVTAGPTGSVSPQYGFSEAKQKELEDQARDDATKDARRKAEQMAKNLGFRLGKVKAVSDGSGLGGGPILLEARGSASVAQDSAMGGLSLNPGENELPYSVTVEYFIH